MKSDFITIMLTGEILVARGSEKEAEWIKDNEEHMESCKAIFKRQRVERIRVNWHGLCYSAVNLCDWLLALFTRVMNLWYAILDRKASDIGQRVYSIYYIECNLDEVCFIPV